MTQHSDSQPILEQPGVLEILFHPRPNPPSSGLRSPDLEIPVEPGITLGASFFPAHGRAPVIMLFHGNGELACEYESVASLYTDRGISLLVIDYRGYGFSNGRPSCAALLHDARVAYRLVPDLLSELGIESSRMFVMGRSLGSAAAIEIASRVRHKLAGLIIESGFAYTFPLIQRLGGPALARIDEKKEGFNNPGKMEHITIPLLVIHGEADHVIPVTDGMALHKHCKAHSKRFVKIPRAGHNDLLLRDAAAYFDAIAAFCLDG